jgi:hypothetical protein
LHPHPRLQALDTSSNSSSSHTQHRPHQHQHTCSAPPSHALSSSLMQASISSAPHPGHPQMLQRTSPTQRGSISSGERSWGGNAGGSYVRQSLGSIRSRCTTDAPSSHSSLTHTPSSQPSLLLSTLSRQLQHQQQRR